VLVQRHRLDLLLVGDGVDRRVSGNALAGLGVELDQLDAGPEGTEG